MKRDWVTCPICGEPDMERTITEEGGEEFPLIKCVNNGCRSNRVDGNDELMQTIRNALKQLELSAYPFDTACSELRKAVLSNERL